jgi:hypothetical protein
MRIEEALKQAWLKVAREVVTNSPDAYTRSELDSVIVGVRGYDPALAEQIERMILIKKPKVK